MLDKPLPFRNEERIEELEKNKVNSFYYNINYSQLDNIPALLGDKFQDKKMYSLIVNPKTSDGIFNGGNFNLIGFQNGNNGAQIAYSYRGSIKQRALVNGVWGEWKTVGEQQITTDQEFETDHIIDGKKEYRKRINIGNLPNASTKNISTGLSGISLTRSIQGVFIGGIQANLPYSDGNANKTINIYLNANGSTLTVACAQYDYSSYTGIAEIYYTKN